MNAKERIIATLSREPIDRIAIDLWHTPEVSRSLREYYHVKDELELYRIMGLDKIVWVFMDYKNNSGDTVGAQAGAGADGLRTMWGAPLKEVRAGSEIYHEFISPPMATYNDPHTLDSYPYWPDPDYFDYEAAVERAKQASKDFAVIGPWVSLFEVYCQLRGLEQSLMDLALHPALVEALLDRIENIQTEMMKRFFSRAGKYLVLVFISDDVAGQTGLLFSPRTWRQHLQPRMVRLCELIHSYGLKVFYHTDGAAEPLFQPLIDCGIDVLNPIQHLCPGMDPADLKNKYGNRVVFHGGVDNQKVLPFGSSDDVRKEVRYLLDTLGRDRKGFICCSCHNIQANTPLKNILVMVEEVRNMR
jgi:uroporphyrinogen decarboxylase